MSSCFPGTALVGRRLVPTGSQVTYFDVFYYLVVELQGSDRTKVPFRTLRPPVAQQLRVLRVLRDMLGLDDAERSKTAWGGRGQSCVWEARWFQGVCQK